MSLGYREGASGPQSCRGSCFSFPPKPQGSSCRPSSLCLAWLRGLALAPPLTPLCLSAGPVVTQPPRVTSCLTALDSVTPAVTPTTEGHTFTGPEQGGAAAWGEGRVWSPVWPQTPTQQVHEGLMRTMGTNGMPGAFSSEDMRQSAEAGPGVLKPGQGRGGEVSQRPSRTTGPQTVSRPGPAPRFLFSHVSRE